MSTIQQISLSVSNIALAAFSFLLTIIILVSGKMFKTQKGLKSTVASLSLTMLTIGCMLRSCVIPNDLMAIVDFDKVQARINLVLIMTTVSQLSNLIYFPELILFPFKLIYSVDQIFLYVPFRNFLNKHQLKTYYWLYYFTWVIIYAVINIITDLYFVSLNKTFYYVKMCIIYPVLIYQFIFIIIGAVQLKRHILKVNRTYSHSLKNISKKILSCQLWVTALSAALLFISLINGVFADLVNLTDGEYNWINLNLFVSMFVYRVILIVIQSICFVLIINIQKLYEAAILLASGSK